MLLTDIQREGLTSFIGMALSRRTAASLSELVGTSVVIEVANISLQPLHKLSAELDPNFTDRVASVQQNFTGSLSGDALFILDYQLALMLTNLLCRYAGKTPSLLDVSACEVITEIGNTVLSGYISTISNILSNQVSFNVPSFQLTPLNSLLDNMILSHQELRYGMLVNLNLQMCDNAINTHIILVCSVISLSCLIKAVEPLATISYTSNLKRDPMISSH